MSVLQAIDRTTRAAALAIALVAFAPAAHSQQQPSAAALATAKQLITATGTASIFNPMIPGVIEQAKLLILQQDPSLTKDLNEITTQLRAEYAPRFVELSDEVAKLYATDFTDDELKAILAFYQSPAGKKLLDRQPKVIDSSMEFAQQWAARFSDEVVNRMRAELKKRGHPL
jgi:hypothetical protein